MKYLIILMLMISQLAFAAPREIDPHHWTGVERIVAIGDIHGDYDHYIAALQAAGLVNKRGKWVGGETHLVQTGDIPDRGPDTVKIIEHLGKLAKQAHKKGGRVHSLVGNHEAMNVYGDLSYVTPAEYEYFVGPNSAALRDRYFELVMQNLQQADPETLAKLPENYRELWDKSHPLGWVEHRQAWSPAWNPEAELAAWVLDRKVAIQINDLIFLHGGISGFYCQNTLQSLTEKVVSALRNFDPINPGIVEDEYGPLWYRGMAGIEPVAAPETVQAVLEQHGASHIVIGHTPTGGAIWPRYQGRVIQIDTGISSAYGGHVAYLEITPGHMYAGYPDGKIALPASDDDTIPYLEKVIAMNPDNAYLQRMLENLKNPPPVPEMDSDATQGQEIQEAPVQDTNAARPVTGPAESPETETAAAKTDSQEMPAAEPVPQVVTVPICGISE